MEDIEIIQSTQVATVKPEPLFPNFTDMKVSTKTFILMTNMCLNLDTLYNLLPVNETKLLKKVKGRRKTQTLELDENSVSEGSIVTLSFKKEMKGIELKPRKDSKRKRWFRNSFTVVMFVDGKTINFKVYSNGIFQLTGCKSDSQAEGCIKHMWNHIKYRSELYSLRSSSVSLEVLFIPAMRNIDHHLGFIVDREKLTQYVSTQTEHHSLLECSYGYTGVNIKIRIDKPISLMKIGKLVFNEKENRYDNLETTYAEYLDLLPAKERKKKIEKVRYMTVLVFHSGAIIISAIQADFCKESFDKFVKLIQDSRDFIEERLDE